MDFCTVFGCCVELLVTVSVSQPHNLVDNTVSQHMIICSDTAIEVTAKNNKADNYTDKSKRPHIRVICVTHL